MNAKYLGMRTTKLGLHGHTMFSLLVITDVIIQPIIPPTTIPVSTSKYRYIFLPQTIGAKEETPGQGVRTPFGTLGCMCVQWRKNERALFDTKQTVSPSEFGGVVQLYLHSIHRPDPGEASLVLFALFPVAHSLIYRFALSPPHIPY